MPRKSYDLRQFTDYIPFKVVEQVMTKEDYKRFLKFMGGQTVSEHGVYAWDLERFIKLHNAGVPVNKMPVYD
jgi:hypothetical protein